MKRISDWFGRKDPSDEFSTYLKELKELMAATTIATSRVASGVTSTSSSPLITSCGPNTGYSSQPLLGTGTSANPYSQSRTFRTWYESPEDDLREAQVKIVMLQRQLNVAADLLAAQQGLTVEKAIEIIDQVDEAREKRKAERIREAQNARLREDGAPLSALARAYSNAGVEMGRMRVEFDIDV